MKITNGIPELIPAEIEIQGGAIEEAEFSAKDRYARVVTKGYIIESYDACVSDDGLDLGCDIAITKREEREC